MLPRESKNAPKWVFYIPLAFHNIDCMKALPVFFNLLLIFALESCQSDGGVEPEPDDTVKVDSIDSNTIYPLCIPDTSRAGTFGCFNMFFGRRLNDKEKPEKVIIVKIDPELVLVTNKCISYNIPHEGISIEYLISKEHPDSIYFDFCNDVIREDIGTPFSYLAISGQLRISSDIDTVTISDSFFYISAELSSVHFELPDSDTTINNLRFNQIRQGDTY